MTIGTKKTASAQALRAVRTSQEASSASQGVPTLTATPIATKYMYIPVLTDNSGAGMQPAFSYTYDASTARQTTASLLESATGVSPWSVSGQQMESTDRSAKGGPLTEVGAYHYIIWANYKWAEYSYGYCDVTCVYMDAWSLDHWQGSLTDYNPNPQCYHCGATGYVNYAYPAFTTNPNYVVGLTSHYPSWTRNQNQYWTYSFAADFAGFVTYQTTASYGSITSVTWSRTSAGCGSGTALWGNGNDPVAAPIVQANCWNYPK